MGIDWKQKLKSSALEALRGASRKSLDEARGLMKTLDKLEIAIKLNAKGDGLLVSPGSSTLTPELANSIRDLKPDLLEVLRSEMQVWRWQPEDVAVKVSLSESTVVDFVLAPPVEGVKSVKLTAELEKALLEDAPREWRTRVKEMGGLNVYSLSQWETARPLLESVLAKTSQSTKRESA